MLEPFRVHVANAANWISRSTARRLLQGRAAFDRPRLGYREVAASTNRLTLIAAIVPADVVTTHTIFCLKDPLDLHAQWFLCGIFNSFVANYLVRLRGGTHVTASIVASLPDPEACARLRGLRSNRSAGPSRSRAQAPAPAPTPSFRHEPHGCMDAMVRASPTCSRPSLWSIATNETPARAHSTSWNELVRRIDPSQSVAYSGETRWPRMGSRSTCGNASDATPAQSPARRNTRFRSASIVVG